MMRSAASRHLCITFWSKEDERKMNNNIKKNNQAQQHIENEEKKNEYLRELLCILATILACFHVPTIPYRTVSHLFRIP